MKKLTLGLLALALTSTTAFAQGYLKCDLRIGDNDPDCPFIGKCPQKSLKTSTSQLVLELNDGDQKEGSIGLKKVLVFDKKDKVKNDVKITIFADDDRAEKLKTEKNLRAQTYDVSSIKYEAQKFGDTIDIKFSAINNWKFSFHGVFGPMTTVLYSANNAVFVSCSSLSNKIYDDEKAKREAIEKYKEEKRARSQQGGASRQ